MQKVMLSNSEFEIYSNSVIFSNTNATIAICIKQVCVCACVFRGLCKSNVHQVPSFRVAGVYIVRVNYNSHSGAPRSAFMNMYADPVE